MANKLYVITTDADGNIIGVSNANTARNTSTKVLPVQPIDEAGNVLGRTAANTARNTSTLVAPSQIVDANGNVISIDPANTARTNGTKVLPVQIIDAAGKIGGNPLVYGEIYASPSDFSAVYASSTTITITGAPFNFDDSACYILKIDFKPTGGSWNGLINGVNGVSIVALNGVVTVSGAGTPFASGDTYRVMVATQKKAYDSTTDVLKIINQNPDSSKYVQDSIIDATNIAAGTAYYPSALGMSMDGFSAIAISGKLIDADNTTTLTIEGSQDEDAANADWVDITKAFNDDNAGVATSIGASITVTNATKLFAISKQMFNYNLFRFKLVTGDATNTVILKTRRIY